MNAPFRAPRLPYTPRPPSPAMQAAMDAMRDHARRWVQARRDTLAEHGSDAEPCRDVRPGIGPIQPSRADSRKRLP